MKYIYAIIIFSLVLPITSIADENKDNAIPFIIHKSKLEVIPATSYSTLTMSQLMGQTYNFDSIPSGFSFFTPIQITQTTETAKIDPSEIKKVVSDLQSTICSSIKNGSVKVWLSADVSGKLLGVGAAAQSGIEVTFECKYATNPPATNNQ